MKLTLLISVRNLHEGFLPVLAMYKSENFEDALAKAEQLIADGDYGHTSSIILMKLPKLKNLQSLKHV